MNLSVVKTGNRGRPRFRRFTGFISSHGPYWAFSPDSPDLFGYDRILLNLPYSLISKRDLLSINRLLQKGDISHVELSFSGKYVIVDQLSFFDFRFIRFVVPARA